MSKILIIEDDTSLYKIYQTELSMQGHEVSNVADGMLAVDAIKSQKPDIVLLDLMLPGKNGLEILQEIKQDDEIVATKVVMLTNYGDSSNVEKALQAGAMGYLLKYNIVPEELSQKVAEYLGNSSNSAVKLTNM